MTTGLLEQQQQRVDVNSAESIYHLLYVIFLLHYVTRCLLGGGFVMVMF
jgi:hypothetical protein